MHASRHYFYFGGQPIVVSASLWSTLLGAYPVLGRRQRLSARDTSSGALLYDGEGYSLWQEGGGRLGGGFTEHGQR